MSNQKVKELPTFERDPITRAIINTDKAGYEAHMLRKRKNREKNLEIAQLKSEVSDLKSLVIQLMDKIDG